MYLRRSSVFKGRDKDSENVLFALLPGARINKENHKITINVGTSNETIVFNIGGTKFETYRSTLNRLPFSPLADEKFLKKHHREDKGDYFFDREPDVFKAILNYLRTGELHLPGWLCGASIKNELHFWGVEEDEIEECCWTSYNSWTTTLEALKRLEKDMKRSLGQATEKTHGPMTKWNVFCQKGWSLMNNPQSSGWAKVFGMISVTFVLLSIFSFCAETHEAYQLFGNTSDPRSNTTVQIAPNENKVTDHATTYTTDLKGDNPGQHSESLLHPHLFILDTLCMIYFLTEFVTRFVLAPNKWRYFIFPMTIVDLSAILPDIIDIVYRIATSNFHSRYVVKVLMILRVTRIFRIFRLVRTFPGLWILFYTLKASMKELLLMMLFLCVGMLVYASLIYFVDDRDTFSSIPKGFWWALITMTTVGYGEMVPVTNLGYLVGSLTAISGLLMIGFTVPILVNNFILYYSHTQSSLIRERNRVERIKKLVAEARNRRPSMMSVVFGSRSQRKDDEGIQMSSLASLAEDASNKRNSCEKKRSIDGPESQHLVKDRNSNSENDC